MLFNSAEYLFFFVAVLGIYYLIPAQGARQFFLVVASAFFYMYLIPAYILILLAVIIIDYFSGRKIGNTNDPKVKKTWLLVSILSNLSILFFFKYYNFFLDNLGHISGKELPHLSIILPIGLSFHTFQSLSYIIEVYRGRFESEKSLLTFALYVLYFPQLVAGPIERPQNVIPQLKILQVFSFSGLIRGLQFISLGLVMKCVLADRLSIFVDEYYSGTIEGGPFPALIAVISFSFQIFFDFAGYSLVAVGSSRCLGIQLMRNFDKPYLSRSIREFWNRWHISLSSWFRDYVYIPLGGKSKTRIILFRNIMVVFVLSGLWHGASWNFIIWGAVHGLFVYLSHTWKWSFESFSRHLVFIDIGMNFFLVSFLWVFFRANSLAQAMDVFGQVANLNVETDHLTFLKNVKTGLFSMLLTGVGAMVLGLNSYISKVWPNDSRKLLFTAAFNFIIVFSLGVFQQQSFIYFQF